MSNRRSSTNLLHPGMAFCFNATASMTTVMKQRNQTDWGVDFCIRSFREKNSARWWSNAFAAAALRRRARVRKRARRVRARPWRRRCVQGRQEREATQAARPPRATGPDRGGAPRATRNRATARRREASRCPAAGGCSCITSGSSRRSRSGGTTSACRSLTSRGAVVAHPTSSSRVARRCRLNARAFPRPTRAADLFRAPRSSGSEDARATNRGGDDLVGRPEHRARRAVPRARVTHRSRFSPVLSLASLPHFHTGAPRCTARAAVP